VPSRHDRLPAVFLGAIKAGIVPIAANTLLTAADYDYMLRDSRARALVVSAPLLPAFAPILAKAFPAVANHRLRRRGRGGERTAPFARRADGGGIAVVCPGGDDLRRRVLLALFLGSTGSPKGTVHLHSSLVQTAELYAKPILGIREDDVVFSAAKLFFRLRAGQRADVSARRRRHRGADGRATDAGRGFQPIEEGPAHDLLRRAHALCRAARLSRCAEARSARTAALCFGR
jgi:hypothetical protein